ncbi:MAG: dihydrofolate reductase family protein [Hyphomicrobiales bacterium]|nr:dihydrofolate reductase family protein [Hyphomicrobiales bacterium]
MRPHDDAGNPWRHEPFVSASNAAAGPRPVFVARKAELYAVSVDTLGKLRWKSSDLRGDHLICIISERAPADYVDGLREKGISYIVSGVGGIDLADAVEKSGEHFGIRRLLLEGSGHINGAFLQAG